MITTTVLGFGALLFLVYKSVTRWIPHYYARRDMHIPEPINKRTDLLFGYYLVLGDQVNETRDHTNLIYDGQFMGLDGLVSNMRSANKRTVIDVAHQMTVRNEQALCVLRPDAEPRLRELLAHLKTQAVLHNVVGITAGDEPNSQFAGLAVWTGAVDIIRRVASEFPELVNLKIWMLLNGAAPMQEWVPHADVVGFDCYNRKSSIFLKKSWLPPKKDGEYTQLRRMLRPGQRTFLVPGGAKGKNEFEQDPTPFINAAHTYPEVIAIVPFLWTSVVDKDIPIMGIRDIPAMRAAYTAAGRAITGVK